MYRLLYWLLLRHLPAEATHRWAFAALRALCRVPLAQRALAWWLAPRDPALVVEAMGLRFASPLGLAAGFDKDAEGVEPLLALGFGFLEVGTVTAEPQPGNPRPRLFRLVKDRALLNRMGFNNHGAEAAAERLRGPRSGVVGVNIGKTKVVAEDDAAMDYAASARRLATVADYLVVNVSSPNTPGLRSLQSVDKLRPVLRATREACDAASPLRKVPLLVKIAPDLLDEEIDAVAELVLELGLDGIIATNTTIRRDHLRTAAAQVTALGAGGISGPPVKTRSLEVLRRLATRVGARVLIISAGGVESADDVEERLAMGASLVQAYTGFVYGGPLWAARIHRELSRRRRARARAAS
ncbi:MAG TPA: quinone-dependent dihydroorotate dehydrogenase [Kofleriaceae bacterium]|nr:quinone-dependent dihydroorotate dehydrogenase [Kofleriaceae bacterium]